MHVKLSHLPCLQSIRLKAGFALAIFAFNNTPQQYSIREAGGIRCDYDVNRAFHKLVVTKAK